MGWMDHRKMEPRKITITTLSPIHIGCDEDFVPAEFVISNNVLHYLDMAVMADTLDASERYALGGMQTIGAIQQFFKARRDRFVPLSTHGVEIASDIAKEYDEKAGKPTQSGMNGESIYNQFTLARTAYRVIDFSPYLPGSSLKGSMRTAWLDTLNGGRTLGQSGMTGTVKSRHDRELQQNLLGYTSGNFQNDPLRHLRVSDAHHGEESIASPTRILYAVSRKKKPGERAAADLNFRLETIPGLLDDAFAGEIRFTENKVTNNPVTWGRLCEACNNFYWPQLEGELGHAHLACVLDQTWRVLVKSLLADELQTLRENNQGFLLRVGRHSGAESMTLNGVRDIMILGKKGGPPSYRNETTEKRFASQAKTAMDGLLPFGWVWVESCEDKFQYLSAAIRDKLRPHSQPLREAQRCRLQQIEEARDARLVAAQAAEQKRLETEEAERQEEQKEQARHAALNAMSPSLRRIEELRAEIEKRLAFGHKIAVNDQFYAQIKALADLALESPDWSAEEKSALADMLQEWAGKLMKVDPKDLRKRLRLAALRGLA